MWSQTDSNPTNIISLHYPFLTVNKSTKTYRLTNKYTVWQLSLRCDAGNISREIFNFHQFHWQTLRTAIHSLLKITTGLVLYKGKLFVNTWKVNTYEWFPLQKKTTEKSNSRLNPFHHCMQLHKLGSIISNHQNYMHAHNLKHNKERSHIT